MLRSSDPGAWLQIADKTICKGGNLPLPCEGVIARPVTVQQQHSRTKGRMHICYDVRKVFLFHNNKHENLCSLL